MPKTNEEHKPLWTNPENQEKILDQFEKISKDAGGVQFILLLDGSCLLGYKGKKIKENLWGLTHEAYGEVLAQFIFQGTNIEGSSAMCAEGLVVDILKRSRELRQKILKALLEEKISNISLGDQKLYDRCVD